MTALHGINLGGWLVAEKWMTPSLFESVKGLGEQALGRELGQDEAGRRLKGHRKSFITEQDFAWIAKAGLEVVRLPVGYWLFEDDDGFVSGKSYVDRAFAWAHKYHLRVILDFHGLQGSQNGYEHSGQVGPIRMYHRTNRRRSLDTLQRLAKEYGNMPALLGIEIINEPKVCWLLWRLIAYYREAYEIVKQFTAPHVKIIVSDAFKPLRMAKALHRRGFGNRLVLDIHLYQVFRELDQELSFAEHIVYVEHEWRTLLERVTHYVPIVMVGEWSAALPAVAYRDLPGNESDYAHDYYAAQKKLFDELTWAHCYWSYKAPTAGVWDYKTLAKYAY